MWSLANLPRRGTEREHCKPVPAIAWPGLSASTLPLSNPDSYGTNWPLTSLRFLWEEMADGEVSSKNLLEKSGGENEKTASTII